MRAEPVEFEKVGDRNADAHVGDLLGVPLADRASVLTDLIEGAADSFRVTCELHRRGVGEELALPRDCRLDQTAGDNADGAEQPQHEADQPQADVAAGAAATPADAHDEATDRADQYDAGDHTQQADVQPHVAIENMAELV